MSQPFSEPDGTGAPDWRTGVCPPLADVLLAVEAAVTGAATGDADARLDDLARPLFGLAGAPDEEAADCLAGVLLGPRPFAQDEDDPAGLLLERVLERRAGHPMLLAVVLAETGRRAGLPALVLSSPHGWYAGLGGAERLCLIDTTGGAAQPALVRRHCAHEIAFAALAGLEPRLRRTHEFECAERARHAPQAPVRPRPSGPPRRRGRPAPGALVGPPVAPISARRSRSGGRRDRGRGSGPRSRPPRGSA